ncbi:MAG: diacylglycerol kinase family protein, partial [Acidobacteria bacterium]|nr:diacylglycerol kinase family protein [Acidobacteriota bacterium]
MKPYFAIVNPAAGGGRCGRQAPAALERLRSQGVPLESVETQRAQQATSLCREAYRRGFRRFLAVGGDGTGFEVVNGLFPREDESEPVTLGFLPLGTGNSFLRDFSHRGLDHAVEALVGRRSRPCDVMRLTHAAGAVHYINLLSIGFTADAGELTNRRYKGWGELGYLMAILRCWMGLRYPTFPFRLEEGGETHRQPCTYLTFSNSRFTGGKLMIAPQADIADGLIEITRVGAIGRW